MLRECIGVTPRHAPALGRHQVLFFEPDRGTGESGGTGGQGGGSDPAAGYQRLLERHQNNALDMARTLYDENFRYRERIRELERSAPAQGALVLSAEQAAQWQAYQQLGTAEGLTQQLTAAQTAQTELAGLKRSTLIRDVADVAGYKASVLGQLPGADKLDFIIREADGKQSVVVKDGDTETALADYAQQQWADFLPALQAGQHAQQARGTGFVRQDAGGKAPQGDMAGAFFTQAQAARDAAPNPLNPKQA